MSILRDELNKETFKIEKVLEATLDEWVQFEEKSIRSDTIYSYPCISCLADVHYYNFLNSKQSKQVGYYLIGGGTHIKIKVVPTYSYYA